MKDFITRYETVKIDGAEAFYDGAIIGELIRCKDCKFSCVDSVEADGVEPFRACKLKRDSEAIYKIWAVNDDDYCSWAEPKDE